MSKLSIYDLTRVWFDFCFENPEKINPNHSALYFFMLSHCNRLGWKEKFGLPTTMCKEAVGIKSYNTYIKTLNELVEFGFVIMIEKSKNQYSTNIIALSNIDKALDKALDKATIKHLTKQSESKEESNSSIIIPIHNETIKKIDNNSSLFQSDIMDKVDISIQVIEYLNLKKGNAIGFKAVNGNLRHIKARIKEGYKLEDFKKVIDFKINQWGNDKKMKEFIRPKTLFDSENFNGYLMNAEESKNNFDRSSSSNFIEKEATESDLI